LDDRHERTPLVGVPPEQGGDRRRLGGIGADAGGVARAVLGLVAADAARMTPPVSGPAVEGLKFSECLPTDLATQVVQARLADPRAVATTLGRTSRVVAST
jgi:hypothetical protein